jgi:hypothetical protein
MIHPHRAVRVFFIVSLTMTGTGLTGCATQDKQAQATSGVKSAKLHSAGKTAKPSRRNHRRMASAPHRFPHLPQMLMRNLPERH